MSLKRETNSSVESVDRVPSGNIRVDFLIKIREERNGEKRFMNIRFITES